MRPLLVFLSLVVAFVAPAFAQPPHVTADERDASLAVERVLAVEYDLVGVPAGGAFVDDLQQNFVLTQFVDKESADSYGPKAMLPFVDDQCPAGWEQRMDEAGEPLFYAFGLLVTAGGKPRSSYVRMPACVKQ